MDTPASTLNYIQGVFSRQIFSFLPGALDLLRR